MEEFPKIQMQLDKLVMVVNHAERKETDPNKAEYLHWLRTQLEAIAIDESQHREF